MSKQVRVLTANKPVNQGLGPNELNIDMNARGGLKTFHHDGVTYTLGPEEVKTVPDVVATLWVAADAQVYITNDGLN